MREHIAKTLRRLAQRIDPVEPCYPQHGTIMEFDHTQGTWSVRPLPGWRSSVPYAVMPPEASPFVNTLSPFGF